MIWYAIVTVYVYTTASSVYSRQFNECVCVCALHIHVRAHVYDMETSRGYDMKCLRCTCAMCVR